MAFYRGLVTTPSSVKYEGRSVAVGAFPIGIDPDKFTDGLKSPKVQNRIASLENKFQGTKLMVSVDRLDYIKGIPQKLHALEVFLQNHPEWVGKVVLVQVAVPSRQDVEEYQNLRAVVNELVGRINGKFGKKGSPWLKLADNTSLIPSFKQVLSTTCLFTSCTSQLALMSSLPCTLPRTPALSPLLETG